MDLDPDDQRFVRRANMSGLQLECREDTNWADAARIQAVKKHDISSRSQMVEQVSNPPSWTTILLVRSRRSSMGN